MNSILILRGPASVGKTTIAKLVQQELGDNWMVLDVSKFKRVVPARAGEPSGSERTQLAHDVSHYLAKQLYTKGYDVILESSYNQPYNDALLEFLRSNHMRYIKVFLAAPVETVVRRHVSRRKQESTEADIRRRHAEIMPYDDDLVIETDRHTAEEAAAMIIDRVRQANQPA